jgi:UDP-N-acetylglucosamine--N-acetylmuramyl-(pentapeptide) pyrophosphoryl-undecaprenol N-acetylglucosamine transferase
MKAVTVGGHLTPALALIDHTNHHSLGVEWWFFGRLYNRTGQKSQEPLEIALRQNTHFISFASPKLAGKTWQMLWLLPQLLWATALALVSLTRIKPDVVVVFGGYLAVPVVMAAKLLRIKVIAHEQTMIPGLANRVIARVADQLAVTFPESISSFSHPQLSVIGNAVRPSALSDSLPMPDWYHNPKKLPILLILGGSQGSQALNKLMLELVPKLAGHWYIVHQLGNTDGSATDLVQQQLRKLTEQQQQYVCSAWLAADAMYWLFHQDARVVSRAGANTVYELALTRTPAVLVPLPNSARGEQQAHAEWLAQKGGAIVRDQAKLTPQSLLNAIEQLDREYRFMQTQLMNVALPTDATTKLYLLMRYVAT